MPWMMDLMGGKLDTLAILGGLFVVDIEEAKTCSSSSSSRGAHTENREQRTELERERERMSE